MSNIYIQEPPTNGKVLLLTSVGDIDIELWSKEAPKACRNFVQLCLENYYNNTIFHRIVRGFCIQGGDPTGTGLGGENIYGQSGFKDELHQRLKFNRRGLVAMANSGPNDNQSQFFFTLDRTDELNGKHTIFGKVTGNTIYNMLKMADMEVDGNDHPLYPPKIHRTEVLSNPFEDIVPRNSRGRTEKKAESDKKPKAKGTKNFSLLSFGDEAEDDEEEVKTVTKQMKMKSSHDVLDDPALSKESAVPKESQQQEKKKKRKQSSSSDDSDDEFENKMREQVRSTLKRNKSEKEESEEQPTSLASDKTNKLREESRKLQKELVDSKRKQKENEQKKEEKEDIKHHKSDVVAEFRAEQQNYLEKKKSSIRAKAGGRDEQTYSLLADFQAKLLHAEEEEELKTDAHKTSTNEENDEDIDDTGWLSHTLKCDTQGPNVKDANVQDADTFEIFDPRNPINKRRREASKQTMKDRKRR